MASILIPGIVKKFRTKASFNILIQPGSDMNISLQSDWQNYINNSFIPPLNQFLNTNPKVDAIEVWNEEDDSCSGGPSGYCPTVPADAYALMLKRAAAAIKAKNPNIK